MKIIGLTGFPGAGKDTLAIGLAPYGYERFAFADPMREALLALNPDVASTLGENPRRLASLVETFGWDGAKRHFLYGQEVRRLLQRFGTEMGRQCFGEDFWVDLTFRKIRAARPDKVVLTDVRFENEARGIVQRGGHVVQVLRPGVARVNAHVSENPIDPSLISIVVANDGDVEMLYQSALRLLQFTEQIDVPATFG